LAEQQAMGWSKDWLVVIAFIAMIVGFGVRLASFEMPQAVALHVTNRESADVSTTSMQEDELQDVMFS